MNFVHGCEREGLENYFHECNIASTGKLLAALQEHHGEPAPPTIEEKAKRKIWFEIIEEIKLEAAAEPVPPSISNIKKAVCKYFNITPLQLVADRRTHDIVRPRQIAMYLSREITPKSLPEIGRRFGGRDHTTVMAAVAKVQELMRDDWIIAHDVAHLEAALS